MAVQTITYDDKSYLNQNSSIADVNKVNDTDMNMIKSVVNNNAGVLSNNVNISESEVLIGVDNNGNNVYRNKLSYTVTGNTITDISSLNIAILYDYNSICHRYGSNNNDFEKPYYNGSSDYFRSFVRLNTNTIETRITIASGYSTYKIETTLIYTKTS